VPLRVDERHDERDDVISWAWWYPVLAVVALVIAIYFVVRGATCSTGGRAICWAHALMAAGMATMFTPWSSAVPASAGAVAFTVVGAWFAADRLRRGADAADEATHVAVGSAAMVVMYLGMPSHSEPAQVGTGHAGHLAAAAGTSSLLTVAVGLALTGYFAWHAWDTSAGPRRAEPVDGPGGTLVLTRVRTETAAHVVLDVLMAVMFLSML
jgi:hypothetical protein